MVLSLSLSSHYRFSLSLYPHTTIGSLSLCSAEGGAASGAPPRRRLRSLSHCSSSLSLARFRPPLLPPRSAAAACSNLGENRRLRRLPHSSPPPSHLNLYLSRSLGRWTQAQQTPPPRCAAIAGPPPAPSSSRQIRRRRSTPRPPGAAAVRLRSTDLAFSRSSRSEFPLPLACPESPPTAAASPESRPGVAAGSSGGQWLAGGAPPPAAAVGSKSPAATSPGAAVAVSRRAPTIHHPFSLVLSLTIENDENV
ncbi:uncharacterized protein LOC131007826 [Salvia miltiorrhiza]|uniref:uncharacterized protein LOC131007826 n=1 Tax=Salvia miltiorrhiza TaxID=226208 RepID=UPI0025ABF7A3|nr:uncharacterized protein LOC131007826 [Salvia miltiorrhiza]